MIPVLHIITDDTILARDGFISRAAGVLEVGGADVALHVRGPRTTGRSLYSLARALKEPASASGSTLLVNDRVDLALALGLPGVHLGQRSLPPAVTRSVLGPGMLIGLSVHDVEEAKEGLGGMVDYVLAGTIFPSPSHPGAEPGGCARIHDLLEVLHVPILAIGGITRERVAEVLQAGAHGVAVRGGIWDSGDPTTATRVYLDELKQGRGI